MASPERKHNFASLRDQILSQNGKEYWRSIEEHADTPEFRDFITEEYPHEIERWDNSLSRRNFVKVMGASLALAGLSGCVIQPPEKIVPYVTPQEGMLPGLANFYATAMSLGGSRCQLGASSSGGVDRGPLSSSTMTTIPIRMKTVNSTLEIRLRLSRPLDPF